MMISVVIFRQQVCTTVTKAGQCSRASLSTLITKASHRRFSCKYEDTKNQFLQQEKQLENVAARLKYLHTELRLALHHQDHLLRKQLETNSWLQYYEKQLQRPVTGCIIDDSPQRKH